MKKLSLLMSVFVLLYNNVLSQTTSMSVQCTSKKGECTMEFKAEEGTLTCNCPESSMLLQTNGEEEGDFSVISPYLDYFKDYLNTKYQRSTIAVKSVNYQLFEDAKVVAIHYISPEGNATGSVMYVTHLEGSASKSGTVEIDCLGPCETSSSIRECTEVYSKHTGDIACSCGGGCKMRVRDVE